MSKVRISILILILIFLTQFYYIYNKSYSGYMFHTKYNSERVNIDYVVLSYNLLMAKEIIPNDSSTIMSIFIKDEESKYNIPLLYWYNKRNFYPITMPRNHQLLDMSEYTNERFSSSLEKENVNYIILVGKNINILNVNTEKDISIYKVNNTNLELIYDYNNTLTDLEKNSYKFNHVNYYQKVMKYIETYLDDYSNDYGESAYQYIYSYANDLISEGKKELGEKYYKKYLKILSLNPTVLLNKAEVYVYLEEYDNAMTMINACLENSECNLEKAGQIKNILEVRK